jgi:hypothetical protein
MQPPAEMVHWLFATGLLLLGLCLACEGIVGEEVWRMRPWRRYLWPGLVFVMGVFMWPVMALYTNSAIHMYAHGSWAEVLCLAGGAELGLVHGRLKNRWWHLTMPFAFVVSGTAFIVHEQNAWYFSRSAFLHHLLGWTFLIAAVFPLGMAIWPRSKVFRAGFALTFVVVATMLYTDRDVAPIFGHLSAYAGIPHR